MDLRDENGRFKKGRKLKGKLNPFFGRSHSKKTKEAMRKAKLKNPTKYWLGKKRDAKTCKAISKAQKNRQHGKGKDATYWKGGGSQWWHNQGRSKMAKKLGRKLKAIEIVHHIDGNYKNNKYNNLVITNRSEHAKIHHGQGDLKLWGK